MYSPTPTVSKYIGRFAPTPSGALHFGSLIAALGSYLDARAHHGQWLLRIEDVDRVRSSMRHAIDIQATLAAFGLTWDGEIRTQSRHIDEYLTILETLKDQLYPCGCSRKMWHAVAKMGELGPIYPGTCRQHPFTTLSPQDAAIRLKLPAQTITFYDRLLGSCQYHLQDDIGDPILRRRDGDIAYALAVTIDDALQGITDIVRGQDLTAATAIQLYLQQCLGYKTPRYLHLPLALDEHGRKLSKQNHAHPVDRSDPLPALQSALTFLGLETAPYRNTNDLLKWATVHWYEKYANRDSQSYN
ncbi:tRNA glutamyl-Q(34) synthetase GluQRS [Cardiobacteriaceae bacterium TAE3-ERU3]|nr:tRNA glutamyl-Q(34) synthetase GluQRS [Cardiobacteriaceae bacterium TAE3-ERU3]